MFKIALVVLLAVVPFISSQLVGGQVPYTTTLNDPNVLFAVKAINSFYQQQGDNNLRTGVKVVRATSQVVAGALYRFTIQVSGGSTNEDCTVVVWSRPWLSGDEATQLQGTPSCVASA
ncbi:cystatin-like protein precursor [Biomphalaria pfeifferi]|uniref:Cystatin-like protein n=1 Tax=Biomphalaria pfeifferi TaxID=112525 RepID=A0AAD8B946_BIOPF|nr:cystatin-like protein precursor [Biomphalaria pfeifferi]